MLNNFQKKALPSLKTNDKLSMYQVLILSSIIEKEVSELKDRKLVAGIFINRLEKGMKLQSDATVNFITQSGRAQSTLDDLKIESPYNTYMHTGLPPGPISMPSIAAIDAVLNYTKHSYYYFAADADRLGYHKFAKTLTQHNVNARDYQRYLSSQGIRN